MKLTEYPLRDQTFQKTQIYAAVRRGAMPMPQYMAMAVARWRAMGARHATDP